MNFHKTNYNTYEAQNFAEQAPHAYERPINFSEFIQPKKIEVIILTKLNHIW